MRVPLEKVRLDGGTQVRVSLDRDVIATYAEAMRAGAAFPKVVVYNDGTDHWLADGFHRFHAAQEAEIDKIDCQIVSGSKRDAVLHAVGANATHGLKRSNADKRRAVEIVLADGAWRKKTDRWIAEKCGVSHNFASDMRKQLSSDDNSDSGRASREGRDGKTYKPNAVKAAVAPHLMDADDAKEAGIDDAFGPEPSSDVLPVAARVEAEEPPVDDLDEVDPRDAIFEEAPPAVAAASPSPRAVVLPPSAPLSEFTTALAAKTKLVEDHLRAAKSAMSSIDTLVRGTRDKLVREVMPSLAWKNFQDTASAIGINLVSVVAFAPGGACGKCGGGGQTNGGKCVTCSGVGWWTEEEKRAAERAAQPARARR